MESAVGLVTREVQEPAQTGCRHFWVIEAPHGLISRGECRYCHAQKEFRNSMRGIDPVRQYKLYESEPGASQGSVRSTRKPIA